MFTHKLRSSRIGGIALLLLAVWQAPPVLAEEPTASEQVRERLQEINPAFQADSIRPTAIDGLYEVTSGPNIFYVSGDGRFLVQGELIDLDHNRNLTAERRQGLVKETIDAIGEENMLVYSPDRGPAEHTITVFTDTTCPYCRQLHLGLLEIIEQYPVKVRYLLFPRAGLQADSADTMRDVWCAADPQQAMTDAKAGKPVAPRSEDCSTPIAQHFRLGQRLNISGTPYLLVDGHIVPGYRSNEVLLGMMGLQEDAGG